MSVLQRLRWSMVWVVVLVACGAAEEASEEEISSDVGDATSQEGADTPQTDVTASEPIDCGDPMFPEPTTLRRHPYVQSVTPTSARIIWTATVESQGTVQVAAQKDGRWWDVNAGTEAFPVSRTGDMVDYWAYDAWIDGLEDGQRYCYRVYQGGQMVANGLMFDAAWTDPSRPVRILAFGDSGNGSTEQLAVRDAFMDQEFDLFLHLGDMAYGSGTFVEFESRVFDVYRDLLHRVPTWPTMGNHEWKTQEGQPYLDVYYLPEMALRDTEQERYYSFDYGDIHFVSLESNEAPLLLIALDDQTQLFDDDMLDWLRADLEASDATWKIAFFHHPPYSSGNHGSNGGVQGMIVPILEEYGVDLVLVGHEHHYERTELLWENTLMPSNDRQAITYIIAGNGGASLREASGDWFTASVNDQEHGYLSFTIEGCIGTGVAYSSKGETIDTFTIDGCE